MVKIGSNRHVWFTGSRFMKIRCVYKDVSTGKYYVKWGGAYIEVVHPYMNESATSDWRTVEEY